MNRKPLVVSQKQGFVQLHAKLSTRKSYVSSESLINVLLVTLCRFKYPHCMYFKCLLDHPGHFILWEFPGL